MGMNPTGISKLRPPFYCVVPYQAFEAAFEQDLPRNEIKGMMPDHVFSSLTLLKSS